MKKFYISVLFLFALSIFNTHLNAQVAINTTGAAPNGSAMLDVSASDAGILIPHVSLTDVTDNTTISSPANGLMIFHTGTAAMQEGFYFWSSADGNWKLLYSGNVPTVPGNTVYWVRPTGMPYIQPEGNDYIRVNDAGEIYGIYYDGSTNQYGIFSRTTDNSGTTAAVVGFSDVASKQTYGYLGFNGTWTAPTAGFGGIEGAAVYGMVDDADRVAGFFRTTTNATYAANIAYSDVWHASFNYTDNAIVDRDPVSGYFSLQNNVNVTYSGHRQSAIMTLSEYNGGTADDNWSTGAYLQGFANDNQAAIGAYCVGSTSASYWGFGVYASGSDYGVYTSNGNTLTKNRNEVSYGAGLVSVGDLYGTIIKGDVYGSYFSGREYSAYFDGVQYSNDINVQLIDNNTSQRTVTYVPVTQSADIILKGQGQLIDGKAIISFDKNISSVISEDDPIYITITPTSSTEGIYISSSKSTGFEVKENNNGKSSATFNWIAIATRNDFKDFNLDKAVVNDNYDDNFQNVFADFNNVDHSKELYWDGNQLKYGVVPIDVKNNRSKFFNDNYKKTQTQEVIQQ